MAKWNLDTLSIRSKAFELDYSRVPWDEEIFGVPIAQIEHIRFSSLTSAQVKFELFESWMEDQDIHLCSARLPHSNVDESAFLQSRGFRFVELNYCPEIAMPTKAVEVPEGYTIDEVDESDAEWLVEKARHIFTSGRFHNDPSLGAELGNLRYTRWVRNSLADPNHQVVKIVHKETAISFFVFERQPDETAYWWLNGILPEYTGQGHGKNIWKTMMAYHQNSGARRVQTSISSHNIPAMNLYVALGFRFPEPSVTLHNVLRPPPWSPQPCN